LKELVAAITVCWLSGGLEKVDMDEAIAKYVDRWFDGV